MARRKANEYVSPVTRFVEFCKDDKVKFMTCLFMLFLSVLSFLGFVSYLFTWKEDQSKFDMGVLEYLFNSDIQVANWGSKGGGLVAHLLMHNLFGLPSFVFVVLFGLLGLKILHYEPVPFRKVLKHSLIWAVWSSVFLAFVFGDTAFCLGGVFGFWVSRWLESVLGPVGVVLLMLILACAIVIFTFENALSWVKIFVEDFRRHRDIRRAYNSACEFAQKFSDVKKIQEEQNQKNKKYTSSSKKEEVDYDNVDFGDDDDDDEFGDRNRVAAESLNSPVNSGDQKGGPMSFFKDIFSGKDYVGKEQKLDFDTPSQNPAQPNSGLNVPADRNPQPQRPQQDVINEKFVIGGTPSPQPSAADEDLDFEITDTRFNDDTVDIEAPDPNQTPVEIQPGQVQQVPQPLGGDDMSMEVEINHDVRVDVSELPPYDPTAELSNYHLPTTDLLAKGGEKPPVSKLELTENKTRIVNVLKDFKIKIEKITAKIGPTVTLYEIVPAAGVKVSKIKGLEEDIMLRLAATGIRIIAPLPGTGTVGIEVPNKNPEVVTMESMITSSKFQNNSYELPIAIGKTISNEAFVIDLAKCPHLLVAGATGQGKSVGLNAIISSILYKKHPATVKFVLVDPKKVELTLYNNIEKHYLAKLPDSEEAIITDVDKVKETLNSLTVEMENRYDLLKEAQVRNVKEYNEKFIARRLNPERGHKFFPYIIVVIDEFADLIMTAGKDIEKPLARLAQKARAIGIHLIVATQRPTTNIITGTIKANFPARIAFRVSSAVDSKTILDQSGANNLIGRGDMLYTSGLDPIRLQCAFIDTPEVEAVTKYIGSQQGYTQTYELPEPDIEAGEPGEEIDLKKRDSLFEEAARIIVTTQQGSTSMLQRKLEIGYNRAGRIMDQLEAAGVVGPNEGSKARSVNIDNEYMLEQFLSDLDRSL
ncbi:MAG: DNA translocase FtsK [Bacteroidales bacterium]|nr:DNA translocase FtsK [Bacteroidales bacterium]